MKFTNNQNLPEEIVRAIVADDYDFRDPTLKTLSATQLNSPTKQIVLEARHSDEATEDVSDNIWKLLGTSVHYIIDKQSLPGDKILKQRIITPIFDDYKITGKIDNFSLESGALKDYKVTSVWKYVYKDKDGGLNEYIEQLNVYAWLLESIGYSVQSISNILIFRDWEESKVAGNDSYPSKAILEIPQPLWARQDQEKFIFSKVKEIENALTVSDDDIAICSPRERWQTQTTWAIRKRGNKKAMRVLPSLQEAKDWMDTNCDIGASIDIEERPGIDKRCNPKYCPMCHWCNHYKEIAKDEQAD